MNHVIGMIGIQASGKTYYTNRVISALRNKKVVIFAQANELFNFNESPNFIKIPFEEIPHIDLDKINNSIIVFDDFDALLSLYPINKIYGYISCMRQHNNEIIFTAKILQRLPEIIKTMLTDIYVFKLTAPKDLHYMENYLTDEEIEKIPHFEQGEKIHIIL